MTTQKSDLDRLMLAVDTFAERMKARIREKHMQGFKGWDNPWNGTEMFCNLSRKAIELNSKNANGTIPVDIANFAMFLHFISSNEMTDAWDARKIGD